MVTKLRMHRSRAFQMVGPPDAKPICWSKEYIMYTVVNFNYDLTFARNIKCVACKIIIGALNKQLLISSKIVFWRSVFLFFSSLSLFKSLLISFNQACLFLSRAQSSINIEISFHVQAHFKIFRQWEHFSDLLESSCVVVCFWQAKWIICIFDAFILCLLFSSEIFTSQITALSQCLKCPFLRSQFFCLTFLYFSFAQVSGMLYCYLVYINI